MFSKASIVALFAAVASAQHAPVGNPSGNAITRPLNEIVPACKPFTITWQPTTPNSVSLILLRGPSTNVVPLSTIVVGIANSGSYVWTPAATLEADTTHYGLQLIDDVTGQYQYSTQFGISKGAECNGYVATSSSASAYNNGGYPASTPVKSSSAGGYAASTPVVSSKPAANSTTMVTKTSAPVVVSSGYPAVNSTIVLPSKSLTVPSSLLASATSGSATATKSAPAQSTGGASTLSAGFSLVGAVAAMFYML